MSLMNSDGAGNPEHGIELALNFVMVVLVNKVSMMGCMDFTLPKEEITKVFKEQEGDDIQLAKD